MPANPRPSAHTKGKVVRNYLSGHSETPYAPEPARITLNELAKKLGISRERARQLEANTFKKLFKGLYDTDFLYALTQALEMKHDRARIHTLQARILSHPSPHPPSREDTDDCEM